MNGVMSRPYLSPAVRRVAVVSLGAALLFTGCLGPTMSRPDGLDVAQSPAPVGPTVARIVSLNSEHDFVVMEFTSQVMPAAGTRMTIYRNGKPVGAVRITEPSRAQLATADILEGEVHVGDQAR
jgi:hypothetical protein